MLCPHCSRQSVLSRSFSFEVQMSLLLSGLSYHGQMPTQNRALIERGPGCNVVRKCFVVSLVINTRARSVSGSIVPEHICIAVMWENPGKMLPSLKSTRSQRHREPLKPDFLASSSGEDNLPIHTRANNKCNGQLGSITSTLLNTVIFISPNSAGNVLCQPTP